ncbi:MAG: hypothetical protein GOU98_02305 [Candidatus Altiarchaeota archaeon]|nr:hypothetical protein [Candidatus Altiarchaeota archaeon]
MNSGDKFHLAIATILFVGLFSFTMLPPPLAQLGEVFQGFGYTVFEIAKFTGSATDEGMCVLADMWNMGGLDATVVLENPPANIISRNSCKSVNTCNWVCKSNVIGPTAETSGDCSQVCAPELICNRVVNDKTIYTQNITCALLSEKYIAITPKDESIYGDALNGVVSSVTINDKRALNKLFYVSYFMLGLVLAAMIADMWMSTMGRRSTGMAVGLTVMLTIGVVMTLFRAGVIWPYLEVFMKLTPGNNMLGDAIFFTLSLSLVWFIIAQVMHGYNIAKVSHRRFAAVGKAANLDLRRGEKLLDAKEEKSK